MDTLLFEDISKMNYYVETWIIVVVVVVVVEGVAVVLCFRLQHLMPKHHR